MAASWLSGSCCAHRCGRCDRADPIDRVGGVAADGSLDQAALASRSVPVSANTALFSQPPIPVMATLVVGGGGEPRHAVDLDAVVAEVGQRGRVEMGDHVGVEVGRFADLVEQLGGHRVGGDGAAGARVLGDDRGAVGGDLGDREPWLGEVGDAAETRRSCPGGLRPAFDDVPGADGTGEGVVVVGVQLHHQAAAPTTTEASATRPVMTMSAPLSSARAMPNPPR